jgi:hypothetical protein
MMGLFKNSRHHNSGLKQPIYLLRRGKGKGEKKEEIIKDKLEVSGRITLLK